MGAPNPKRLQQSEPHRLARILEQRNMPFQRMFAVGLAVSSTSKLLRLVVAKVTMASRDHDVVLVQGTSQTWDWRLQPQLERQSLSKLGLALTFLKTSRRLDAVLATGMRACLA
eukprot:s3785_g2.t2